MATTAPPSPALRAEALTSSERALTITCCCVVGVTFILRCIGRWALKLKLRRSARVGRWHFFGLDDIFNFFAVLTFYALVTAELIAIDRGMGQHIEVVLYDKGVEGINQYSLAIYVCALTYNTVLGMVKLSVIALYQRILRGIQAPKMIAVTWCVFTLVAMNTTINVFVAAFQCSPIEAAFNTTIKGKCINANAFYIGNAITGVVTDTTVYLLAIPIIKPLHMDLKRKVVTLLSFLVGAFAVITSCVRLAFLPPLLVSPDATYAMGVPMDWSIVEPMVGIIVSSIPAITSIRHFFKMPGQDTSDLDPSLHSSHNHIKLREFGDDAKNTTSISAVPIRHQNKKNMANVDDSSEEHLVGSRWKNPEYISRTTEVEVSYGRTNNV